MRCLAVLLIVCGVAIAAEPDPKTPADGMIERAKHALARNALGEFHREAEAQLRALVSDPLNADADEVLRICTIREFARYFARVPVLTDGQRETLRFLLSSPRLLTTLMMSTSDADPPDRVIEVLRILRGDHRGKLEEFAELTAAMCVVWDAPERFGMEEDAPINADDVTRTFAHLLSVGRVRFDGQNAAAQLLIYVADVELTEQELAWTSRYGGAADVPAIFFDVPYAEGYPYERRELYQRARDDANKHSYVLPNIMRQGGSCLDAAYCAAQIAKATGTPAVVVRAADAGEGATPAWVAFLVGEPRLMWDDASARHPGHLDWPGELSDPQTYETIDVSELALISAEAQTPAQSRHASLALCKSADVVEDGKLLELYTRAIELSPANRRAWRDLADKQAQGKLKGADADRAGELVEQKLAAAFPKFALMIRLRALASAGTLEHAASLTRLRGLFRQRPDLLAEIELAAGDRLRDERRRPEAIIAYLQALRLAGSSPATALRALRRLDEEIRRTEDLPRLAALYAEIFPNLKPPKQTRFGHTTPYYRIGARYAAVLDDVKQPQAAAMVRVKISNVVRPP